MLKLLNDGTEVKEPMSLLFLADILYKGKITEQDFVRSYGHYKSLVYDNLPTKNM